MVKSKLTVSAVELPDLKALYGYEYQTAFDESYFAESAINRRAELAWLQIIPCRHGHIGVWGHNRLSASTKNAGEIANLLATLSCCEVQQRGQDGTTASFAVSDFPMVAALMKPRRRRHLTAAHKEALMKASLPYRFRKATSVPATNLGPKFVPVDDGRTPEPDKTARDALAHEKPR